MPCRRGSSAKRPTRAGRRTLPAASPPWRPWPSPGCATTPCSSSAARAKRNVELKVVTPAVEKVIEANVLLSGLGFESGGLATAHMIGNLLSNEPECKRLMHGEKVGFGIVAQLCLDDEMPVERKAPDRRLRNRYRPAGHAGRSEPSVRPARAAQGDRRRMRRPGLSVSQPPVQSHRRRRVRRHPGRRRARQRAEKSPGIGEENRGQVTGSRKEQGRRRAQLGGAPVCIPGPTAAKAAR